MHSSGKQIPLRAPFVIVRFLQLLKRDRAEKRWAPIASRRISGTALCAVSRRWVEGARLEETSLAAMQGVRKGYFTSSPAHCLPSEKPTFESVTGISEQKFRTLSWQGQTSFPKDALSSSKSDPGTSPLQPPLPTFGKGASNPPTQHSSCCGSASAVLLIGHQVMCSFPEQEAQSFEVGWGIIWESVECSTLALQEESKGEIRLILSNFMGRTGRKQCYLVVSALVWRLGNSGLFWLLQMGSMDDNWPKCWSSVF